MNITDDENILELAYQAVCNFEKASYEEISIDENNRIVYQLDKAMFLALENPKENEVDEKLFEPVFYHSYQELFNLKYSHIFRRNIRAIKPDLLINEIGKNNLSEVLKNEKDLRDIFTLNSKEQDLDNDGTVDRIDINDNKNSIQTVGDLSLVGNDTNREISRSNRSHDELEL